jgi:hypothetical protein
VDREEEVRQRTKADRQINKQKDTEQEEERERECVFFSFCSVLLCSVYLVDERGIGAPAEGVRVSKSGLRNQTTHFL